MMRFCEEKNELSLMRGGVPTGLEPSATEEVFVRHGGGERENVDRVGWGLGVFGSRTDEPVRANRNHVDRLECV